MKETIRRLGTRFLPSTLLVALALTACSDGIDQETELQRQMVLDLNSLAVAQEAFFTGNGSYANNLSQLTFDRTVGVILSIQYATSTGWGAEASNPESRNHCALYEGTTETSFISRWAGILESEPTCKPLPTPVK